MTTSPRQAVAAAAEASPFALDNPANYVAWRDRKLAHYPATAEELIVELEDASSLSLAERARMTELLERANMVIYRLRNTAGADKALIRQLGRQLGLERLDNNLCADADGITSLRVVDAPAAGEYIPYTNKRLNWHTDGYYNTLDHQIRGVILHCVRPAAEGGENAFLDHEIAYIKLRDENPEYVRALMAPDVMTVPPNVQAGREIRPLQTGPVFSIDPGGRLHMRYSARARNILWKKDSTTQAAAECLLNLFQEQSVYIFRHRMKSGEGIISNNVLHCRAGFSDDPASSRTRLLYRARYFDRANGQHIEAQDRQHVMP